MTTAEQTLERTLEDLAERTRDGAFATQLYRGLASRRWPGADDTAVSVSWRRAEDQVNALRARVDADALELAQTGGEGELTDDVRAELGARGWASEGLATDVHQAGHVTSPEDPPPPDHGERMAPGEPREAWERAHEEADAGERHFPGRPGESGAKRGRDPDRRAEG